MVKLVYGIVLISVIVLAFFVSYYLQIGVEPEYVDTGSVEKIIDGDTFVLSSGESVRLLCVDTPEEGEEGYETAKLFLESLVFYKNLSLEMSEISGDKDMYGRLLRFVYTDLGNGERVFVNKEIVDSGFGRILELNEGECDSLR